MTIIEIIAKVEEKAIEEDKVEEEDNILEFFLDAMGDQGVPRARTAYYMLRDGLIKDDE
jgi:hypothetical protein